MQIFRQLEAIPKTLGGSVASVGNFDGVHLAHQHVLRQVCERARALNAKSIAVTFEPHPVRILRPQAGLRLITPLPLKLQLLEATGLEAVVVIPFTKEFSRMTGDEFSAEILHRRLRAREVHEGSNFRFGHLAEGGVRDLAGAGQRLGFEVKIYPEMRIRGEVVSSSHIRELIARGEASRARHLLGRIFSLTSTAQPGRGYGRKYTVPTLNLGSYAELAPANGVYVTRTRVSSVCFDSVTNVGNRPTFGEASYAIESHLLRFTPVEVTAETEIEVFFLYRLRDEIKFPSVEKLRQQIACDVKRSERFFRLLS